MQQHDQQSIAYVQYHIHMAALCGKRLQLGDIIRHIGFIEYYSSMMPQNAHTKSAHTVSIIKNFLQVGHLLLKRDRLEDALAWYDASLETCLQYKQSLEKQTISEYHGQIYNPAIALQSCQINLSLAERSIITTRKKLFEKRFAQFEHLIQSSKLELVCVKQDASLRVELAFKHRANQLVMQEACHTLKIPFTIIDDKLALELLEIQTRHYGKLLDQFQHDITPPASLTPAPNVELSRALPAQSKQEKQKRHEENQLEREQRLANKEAETVTPPPTLPMPTDNQEMVIRWNHSRYPTLHYNAANPTFFRVNGRAELLTFSTFNPAALDTIPLQSIVDKFIDVAKFGRVIRSDSRKGYQGLVFFKHDKELSKYGPQYVCKLKLLGLYGDHRFLGEKVAVGKQMVEGEETGMNCELIEFNRYVRKAHKGA